MEEVTKIETTITTTLDAKDIKRLIIEWLDDCSKVEWGFDFNVRGDVFVKVKIGKIKREG